MTSLYQRWQQPKLQYALNSRRVILISGARQCGKTTLAKALALQDTVYRTLDDLSLRQLALNDPQSFLKHSGKSLIIDEIQHAPGLLSEIKKIVDEDNRVGQFLITGSADIHTLPSVTESLAGRIRKIRLRPLTQGEILGTLPTFLKSAFLQNFIENPNHFDRDRVLELTFRGGFPEAIRLEGRLCKQWHLDYLEALLDRDLKDIANIKRKQAMKSLVHTLCAWSSKLMDVSSVGSGLSITRVTIEHYINALEALYLCERVPPWTKRDYERINKHDKFFITDCGLMTSVLGWQFDKTRLDSDRSGKIIETFVFNELIAQVEASDGEYQLFHYRDREQREIDFIVEREDGALLGIEIKAASTISVKDDLKHLKWFKQNLAKDTPFTGIVLYSGAHVMKLDDFWAIPIGALWV